MAKITITIEEYEEYDEAGIGVCIACGATRECCEPDARNYECEECGERKVFGAGELLFMGRVV